MAGDDIDDLDDTELSDKMHLSTAARLYTHERVCAMRQKMVNARLARIEKILLVVSGTLISGMAWMIFELITSGKISHS